MMRRVFIFGWLDFPRGSASANYVQYFAEALIEAGYEVIVLSNTYGKEKKSDSFFYNGMNVAQLQLSNNKIIHYVQYHYFMERVVLNQLKKYSPCKNDLFITYGEARAQFHKVAFSVRRKYGMKIACCVAEWLGQEDFEKVFEANQYAKTFECMIPKYDLVIPISYKILDFFKEKGTEVLYLPIMSDTHEYEYKYSKTGKYKFIFSANGKMKDNLEEMLKGISRMPAEARRNLEFHLTGVKREKVIEILGDSYNVLADTLIIHNWMEYEDLVELYQSSHYLLLAREKNHMTESNFPSKIPEAMSYGVVPIVSRVGDYASFYLEDKKNSLLMDGCSADVCMKAMIEAISLSEEEYKALSMNCRNFSEDVFDYKNWSDKIRCKFEYIWSLKGE